MELKSTFQINIFSDKHNGIKKVKFLGNPIVLIILFLIAALLGYGFYHLLIEHLIINYFPYEGTVLTIKTDKIDFIFGEGSADKCLVIEGKNGKKIKRFISPFTLVHQRIAVGDYVIKEKGFVKKPYVPGKKSTAEMLNELEKLRK